VRLAARVDENQVEITRGLSKLPGIGYWVTSMLGKGFPDLIVAHRCANYFFEIKNPKQPPSKRKLTPDEQKFHDTWPGQVAVVETLSEILKIIGYVNVTERQSSERTSKSVLRNRTVPGRNRMLTNRSV
jgi:hypothetical protein